MATRDNKCPPGFSPEACDFARRADDEWRQWAEGSINELHQKVEAIKSNTDEIIDFFHAGKGFFTVVRWAGTTAKWITYIAGLVAAVWLWLRYGADYPPKQ